MEASRYLIIVGTLGSLCLLANGYEEGAPTFTCLSRYPRHGADAQSSPAPYTITFNDTKYTANSGIGVKVTITGQKIKGLQMAAFKSSNGEEAVGSFVEYDRSKFHTFTCYGGSKDSMITHSHDHGVVSMTTTWMPPAVNYGDVDFKATIVEDYEVFWVDVTAKLPTSDQANAVAPGYQIPAITGLVTNIDFSGCGKVKGCFLYPTSCSGDDCVTAATFQYLAGDDTYAVELMSNSDQKYVSLGFSDDQLMGSDETVTCIGNAGIMSVQHGWNPEYANEREITKYVTNAKVKHENGRIQCSFTLPNTSIVYKIDQSAKDYKEINLDFDHSSSWHLQIAFGNVWSSSSILLKHKIMPPVSFDKISLKDKSIFRGSAYHAIVHAHVSLMMIAWMFITGVVTVVSRHYRDWLPKKKLFSTKVWFQVHRALAVLVALLTYVGFIIMFALYGAEIREGAGAHAIIGLIIVGLVSVQLIAGMLRPNPDNKWRVYFNWGHRVLGQLCHVLAAVTMFLGFGMEHNLEEMKSFGFTVLGIWLAGQVVWHVAYEIWSWRVKAAKDDQSSEDDKDKANKTSNILTILMVAYIIFLATLTVAGMVAFLIY